MPPIREHSYSSDEGIPTQSRNRECGRKSPDINARASRVGVTNFVNVMRNLHPGEPVKSFPITKETLQQYIDSKCKTNIKAGSLEQYLQHVQAYNMALGFGWDGQVFGPIIKKALDELRLNEETITKKPLDKLRPNEETVTKKALDNSKLNEEIITSERSSQINAPLDPSNEGANRITNLLNISKDNPIDKTIFLDGKFSLDSGQSEPSPHLKFTSTLPTLKSITIRSKARVYKQRIAVSDTTTFASLISFAIGITLPPGKQFIIKDSTSDLEYMPNDIARETIKGVEHAGITVTIEDINFIDDLGMVIP